MSKTLLLADDSVVIQKLVGLSFANEDVEIVTTDNGDDAVVMAKDLKPDVVLADVVMPGKSGYEVCEAIKQDATLAHIPVLLLTGTFEAFDEGRAAEAGANGQITKPFEARALVERVNEVMSAAAAPVATLAAPTIESSSDDYDFFDAEVTSLDSDSPDSLISEEFSSPDLNPAIETEGDPLFGAPGDAAIEELETESGRLALGESVAPSQTPSQSEDDATIAILPDSPPHLPPSVGDPLAGFEDDFEMAEQSIISPPESPATPVHPVSPVPPTAVDPNSSFDPDFEAEVPEPAATVVAAIEATEASVAESYDVSESLVVAPDFEALTVHSPSSAIDQDVAEAPSPVVIGSIGLPNRGADETIVANLDISLAEPAAEPTPSTTQSESSKSWPGTESPVASALDLGPSNVSADELDFAFDVSEQIPASALPDPLGESFSSLMDISESQILAGPPADPEPSVGEIAADTIIEDSFAAGYDVSSSDLATAPPAEVTPMTPALETEDDDSIAIGIDSPASGSLDESDPFADLLNPSTAADEPDLELGTPNPTSSGSGDDRITDLSPLVEQRIQETLEKVAWEAFSELSESIVKQVINRVEKIAWEVIPQMAETLVREEIRKMKGEKD